MFLSQVKNIKQANRRARSDQLRSLALECKRPSHPVQIDSTSERGKREARAHLLKLLVTLCGTFGFLVLRWHLLANKGIETSSTFLTFPLSKMRRKGFQSNFVYKSLPVCLTSPDSSNFTHPSIWVSDKEGGEGDEVCSAASTSCNLSSSPNYISTDKYALANLRKFMGVSIPDYADHLQNFTTSSQAWTSNLTWAIENRYVNGIYGYARNVSSPFAGDALPTGELLFRRGELKELLLAVVSGGFRITTKGGGELNDGVTTVSDGDMLYIPSPQAPGMGMKVYLQPLSPGSILIGVSREEEQVKGNVQYPQQRDG
ncbi:hypothetical protein TrCOL_g8027 [Triparma columacea]|uniref:Uncharacterized protein n=1 Tax=Triparma columacea TaxID=722753 RepID=A0A9W7G520_9STRA|nr:hypothetical protein TrCOL_g8027 [Triparma columacea]